MAIFKGIPTEKHKAYKEKIKKADMDDDEILSLFLSRIKAEGCCETMTQQLNYKCEQHDGNSCPDVVVSKNKYGNYTLHAPNANYKLDFCPWCGVKLR